MKRSGTTIRDPAQIGRRNLNEKNESSPHLRRSLPTRPLPTFRQRKPSIISNALNSDDAEAGPSTWQRLGAATAAAALTLQATFSPLSALAGTAVPPSPPPLIITPDIMDKLPPLPSDFPPLPPLELPKFQQMVLKNGLKVILLEDREAPLVRGTLLMRGGQRASPQDKVGLASIAAAVQRSGGSVAHPNTALDEELEELAAAIEGGAGSDAVSMGFSCLAEDAPRVLNLFSEVVTSPAVPPAKVELFKSQLLNAVAHKNDNPSGIPAREVAKLIYGPESPYVREPSLSQLSSISAGDVSAWLTAWERPDAAVLGIVGDFNPKDMAKLVEEIMGGWKTAAEGPPPVFPTPPLPPQGPIQGKIYLVDRPGASQASIAMAEPGIQMMDEDQVALDVLGGLLNSFGGKLFDELRSRDGLAYSVSGGWSPVPLDHPGLFIATAETAQPAALLKALRQALAEAAKEPPAVSAVERAREESLNSFIFGFSSNVAQLRRSVAFELLGIPQDYLFTYRNRLAKVTAEDVLAAAGRHLHPADAVTVVIGDAKIIKPQIEAALGTPVELLQLQDD